MKRITLIKIRLYFSGVALIFMSMMAISGSLHLFMGNEMEEVQSVKTVSIEHI